MTSQVNHKNIEIWICYDLIWYSTSPPSEIWICYDLIWYSTSPPSEHYNRFVVIVQSSFMFNEGKIVLLKLVAVID